MPLFMVKKEVYEWINNGQKTIELRKGTPKQGDSAVFQCGRKILRGRIVRKEKGNLAEVLREDNYKKVIPSANSLQGAIDFIKKLYGTIEGTFTVYSFVLN